MTSRLTEKFPDVEVDELRRLAFDGDGGGDSDSDSDGEANDGDVGVSGDNDDGGGNQTNGVDSQGWFSFSRSSVLQCHCKTSI